MFTKTLGVVVLSACLGFVYLFETTASSATGLARLLHWPAMLLTGLGPFGVVLLCSDWKRITETLKLIVRQRPMQWQRRNETEAALLHQISTRFYAQGPRAFEDSTAKGLSKPKARTLERLALRMPIADVSELLENERALAETRFADSLSLIGIGLRLAPSVGMLGTILGMTQLLSHLKDPNQIGTQMALALLTTFYGLFFSIVIWTPLQHRLEALRDANLMSFDQTLRWLECLERRKPSQYFADALNLKGPHANT